MEENGGGQTPEDASVADELISPVGESEAARAVGLFFSPVLLPAPISLPTARPDAETRAASSACRWLGAFAVAFGKASSLMRTPVNLLLFAPPV